jgi:hypothetical protein
MYWTFESKMKFFRAMASFIKRIIYRYKGKKEEQEEPAVELLSCSGSFDEHHLFTNQLAQRYPDSNINVSRLNLSVGKRIHFSLLRGGRIQFFIASDA